MPLGIVFKIIPVASGFFFAVSHPDLSQEINEGLQPIWVYAQDAILNALAWLGALV